MKNRIFELEKENEELKKEIARMQARLALYESPNMPTFRPSLYNVERKKFRERRGEDPVSKHIFIHVQVKK